ncbi:MAG: hypothetical protein QME78_12815, partial [Thermodesulfobacteriota bacterium]|nr:hypothetical protein [Thermodesulfobacteriota bacterium]
PARAATRSAAQLAVGLHKNWEKIAMAIDPYKVWANMKLKTWPERYWMVDLFDGAAKAVARAVVSSASRYCCGYGVRLDY